MLKDIQHRIQTFSLLGTAAYYIKLENNLRSCFFVWSSGFKLCIVLGAVSIWTYYRFSSSFSTSSLNLHSEVSHSCPILFDLWGLAHVFILPAESFPLSPQVNIQPIFPCPTHISFCPQSVAWFPNWKQCWLSLCSPSYLYISLSWNPLSPLYYNYLTK